MIIIIETSFFAGIRRRSLSPMAFLPIPVLSDSLSPLFDPEAFHHRSVTPTRRRLFNDASLDKVQSKPPTVREILLY